jgi:hypothetical protein
VKIDAKCARSGFTSFLRTLPLKDNERNTAEHIGNLAVLFAAVDHVPYPVGVYKYVFLENVFSHKVLTFRWNISPPSSWSNIKAKQKPSMKKAPCLENKEKPQNLESE